MQTEYPDHPEPTAEMAVFRAKELFLPRFTRSLCRVPLACSLWPAACGTFGSSSSLDLWICTSPMPHVLRETCFALLGNGHPVSPPFVGAQGRARAVYRRPGATWVLLHVPLYCSVPSTTTCSLGCPSAACLDSACAAVSIGDQKVWGWGVVAVDADTGEQEQTNERPTTMSTSMSQDHRRGERWLCFSNWPRPHTGDGKRRVSWSSEYLLLLGQVDRWLMQAKQKQETGSLRLLFCGYSSGPARVIPHPACTSAHCPAYVRACGIRRWRRGPGSVCPVRLCRTGRRGVDGAKRVGATAGWHGGSDEAVCRRGEDRGDRRSSVRREECMQRR